MDQLWFASPWHFPKGSPVLAAVLYDLERFFEAHASSARTRGSGVANTRGSGVARARGSEVRYTHVMKTVQAKVLKLGLTCDILGPTVMLPVPYWKPAYLLEPKALTTSKEVSVHTIQSADDILATCTAVTPFVHSTKPQNDTKNPSPSTVVAKGSLLAKVHAELDLPAKCGRGRCAYWQGSTRVGAADLYLATSNSREAAASGQQPGGGSQQPAAKRHMPDEHVANRSPGGKRLRLREKQSPTTPASPHGSGEAEVAPPPPTERVSPSGGPPLLPSTATSDMDLELGKMKSRITERCGVAGFHKMASLALV